MLFGVDNSENGKADILIHNLSSGFLIDIFPNRKKCKVENMVL